ncbi:MAG: MFS transporter, partial [Pseudomonadota bacterium]|nr:MFS transporter [Pseudomonadota bacterium]
MSALNPKQIKLGYLWFQTGVNGLNVATMFFAAFSSMAMISFMSFMQPYVLTEILNVPIAQQGSLTGNLHAAQEVIYIFLAGFVGSISDKFGRPLIFSLGFIAVAIGYALYPLANSVEQLYLLRAVYAVGVTGVTIMLSACIVDYIQERSRGRWVGTTSIFNGLGILSMSFLLAKLPAYFQSAGQDAITSGRYAFWTVSCLCLIIAAILLKGLYRGPAVEKKTESIIKQTIQGLRIGKNNPRLAIAYGGAFIGRGDFNVIGTFFSLWLTQEGISRGMTTAEALAIAGPLFGLIQLCALVWAPVMGFITDRLNRLSATILGLAIAGTGYLLMSQVSDPFSSEIYLAGLILGMGETSVIVSVAGLLGQECDKEYRGSIVGVFGGFGGLGILMTS